MKSKNRPSRARVSKIPPKPSSMASRALNEMVNGNDVDGGGRGGRCGNREELGQPACTKRHKRSVSDVQEAHRDEIQCDIQVDETKDDSEEPSIVPETPGFSDGCHENASADLNNEVITEKDKDIFSNSPSTLNWDSFTTLDWTEQGLCIMCNKGDDNVLICCSNDCPLAVHECCLGYPPSFDDMGSFYCPLCSYKGALSESREVEKEVALAKKKVDLVRDSCALFLSGSCQKQPIERVHSTEWNQCRITENLGIIRENRQPREIGSEKSRVMEDQRVVEEKSIGNIVAEKSKKTKISDVSTREDHRELVDSDQRKNEKDQQEIVAAVGCTDGNLGVDTSFVTEKSGVSQTIGHHGKEVNGSVDFGVDSTLLSELFGGRRTQEKRNDTEMVREAEHHMHSEANIGVGTSSSPHKDNLFGGSRKHQKINDTEIVDKRQHASNEEQHMHSEANIGFETCNSPCRDIETVTVHTESRTTSNTVVHPRIVDPPQKPSSKPSIDAEQDVINQNEVKTTSSNSEKRYKSVKRSSNPALPNSRRKKLHWTFEEEEMLKKAVQKFSDKTGKKLSWRNILEYGCNVFNESRTPVDLKDKWRNMAKEGSRARLR